MGERADHAPPPRAVRIGGIAGAPFYVTWGWVGFAVAYLAFSLVLFRSFSTVIAVTTGLMGVALLAASVLVHEAAHAYTAVAFRIPVHRVVATFGGGHTTLDGLAGGPLAGASVALAGPLANLAIAGAAWVGADMAEPDSLTSLLLGLVAVLNLGLALLSLAPGLPMDGGAVVAAAVWALTGDRARGMRLAATLGRVMVTITPLVTVMVWWWWTDESPPVWLWATSIALAGHAALTGRTASRAVAHAAPAYEAIERLTVGEVMAPAIVMPADATLQDGIDEPRGLAVLLDETGRPTLVLVSTTDDGIDIDKLPPSTPLRLAVTRLPESCVVEAGPLDAATGVVRAMGNTGSGIVVLTRLGQAYGYVRGDRVEAALATETGRR